MKGDTFGKVLIFLAGGAIGSVVTWKFVKDKYAQIANEEIKSAKMTFLKMEVERNNNRQPAKQVDLEVEKKEEVEPEEKEVVSKAKLDYSKIVTNSGYSDQTDEAEDETAIESDDEDQELNGKPYVIAPDEFGEFDDYDQVNLTSYADGVLADEYDEPITDVDGLIGLENLERIGEYERDSLHVRNDARKTDFEILVDLHRYSDICLQKENE